MTAFGGGHSDLRPKSSRHREERQLSNFRQSSKEEIGIRSRALVSLYGNTNWTALRKKHIFFL